MTTVPDLVRLTKLDTQFSPRSSPIQYTQHKCTESRPGRKHAEEVERWQRTRALGRGSYGAVYLETCVHGEKSGKVRAVKKICKPSDTKYYRELEALAFFSYPKYERHFVKLLGWYEDRINIFIAMECLGCGDLQQYLDVPLAEEEAKIILYQVLEGLNHMHENGFAHRDLKPANIMVVSTGPDWWIKIADFGLTKRALEDLTQLRSVAGTPTFIAPEVMGYGPFADLQDASYTNAVDLWSVGVITYLVITGDEPFSDLHQLRQYAQYPTSTPFDSLAGTRIDESGCGLIRALMTPDPSARPITRLCLKNPWFANLLESDADNTRSNQPSQPLGHDLTHASDLFEAGDTDNGMNEDWPHSEEYSAPWTTEEVNMATERSGNVDVKHDSLLSGTGEFFPAPQTSTIQDHSPHHATTNLPHSQHVAERDTRTWSLRLPADREWHVLRMTFSPGGNRLATFESCPDYDGDETEVQLWETSSGILKRSLRFDNLSSIVAFSPDGRQLALVRGADLLLWQTKTGSPVEEIPLNKRSDMRYDKVIFSTDGQLVAVVACHCRSTYEEGKAANIIGVWDVETGARVRRRYAGGGRSEHGFDAFPVLTVAALPQGRLVAASKAGGSNCKFRLWDIMTGVKIKSISAPKSNKVTDVAISPDGRLTACFSLVDKSYVASTISVAVWYVYKRKLLNEWTFPVPLALPLFSPDGSLLAAAIKSTSARDIIWIWDVATGNLIHLLKKPACGWIMDLAFSRRGESISAAFLDGSITAWNLSAMEDADSLDEEDGDVRDAGAGAQATRSTYHYNHRYGPAPPLRSLTPVCFSWQNTPTGEMQYLPSPRSIEPEDQLREKEHPGSNVQCVCSEDTVGLQKHA